MNEWSLIDINKSIVSTFCPSNWNPLFLCPIYFLYKDEKKEGSEEGRKHTCSKGKSGEIT